MDNFERDGFLLLKSVIGEQEIKHLKRAIEEHISSASAPGVRHLLRRCLAVRRVSKSPEILAIARKYLGITARPVKAIFFDKTASSNWYVTWHQDLTIAVKEKIEFPGYGPWSIKDGIPHVQPPASVLERVTAIRIHLDDCSEENGALKFIAGTHKFGKLSSQDFSKLKEANEAICCSAAAGDVIVMSPLIVHSSSKATNPSQRGVLHIEYAAGSLAGGMAWNEASGLDGIELILAIEEEFGIEIPDRDAERITTVGEVYDYLRLRLNSTPARECLSQKIFYKLRNSLINNFQVKRSSIEPDTRLSEVLSTSDIAEGWPYLELFIKLKTPDFKRSNEILGFKLKDEMLTMRQLVSALISLNSEKFPDQLDSDEEIWRRLVDVIVGQLNVNREQVKRSASFTKDLGLC